MWASWSSCYGLEILGDPSTSLRMTLLLELAILQQEAWRDILGEEGIGDAAGESLKVHNKFIQEKKDGKIMCD